ncbi:phosphopantetheine attachment site family protein [Acinetobacter sp. 25977_4]|uniref:isochorismatase n=1 Tax=unclassified Acinetobacter calcoaceticus/baumannii complex TaxID=2881046 RepID=UPI0004516018|nr:MULTISPECIES: isochorismatase [unclassified Acinetobacter calcoaceticus/baumannii complex]EXB71581.1 phosphopantetheine attachment site family protein [Acinetobacter sp. 21871]EXT46080.1 phosphopantetheine attachment site family protein [Acinetobacter sp. 25977_7]EXT53460.1 phosphopantetheine attachment site family protein [Acinetobacter sp. 25977_4]EXT61419.1 phosphopantetheine attachment site family protein [Acinetobacter sp. 25977_2]EXT64563.1 phosphopantetheine attachment site family pr
MFYPLPRKIQLAASTSNWPIESRQSILLLVRLDDLENISVWAHQPLADHLEMLSKRAQALEIPVMMIQSSQLQQTMLQLGQHLSSNTQAQVIMAGDLSPLFKQVMQLVLSITDYVAVVNDAILASSLEQHIQWIEKISFDHIQHINTQTLMRLWSLSAPSSQVLSDKGILLAVAEQVGRHPMEIHPEIDLRNYGLDASGVNYLVELWRANGASLTIDELMQTPTLQHIMQLLKR